MKKQYRIYKLDWNDVLIPNRDYYDVNDFREDSIIVFKNFFPNFDTEIEAIDFLEKNIKQFDEYIILPIYKKCENI